MKYKTIVLVWLVFNQNGIAEEEKFSIFLLTYLKQILWFSVNLIDHLFPFDYVRFLEVYFIDIRWKKHINYI